MHFPERLIEALRRGYIRPLKRYLAEIADEDLNRRFEDGEMEGRTPLGVAVNIGFHGRDIVRLLLARGADANALYCIAEAHPPVTPIFDTKDPEITAMLIDAGAPVDDREHLGRTPLMGAVALGHVSTIHMLMSRGADLDVRDSHGATVEVAAKFPSVDPCEPDVARFHERKKKASNVIAEIRAARSWEAYRTYPRRSLLALRVLCEHGRAKPPEAIALDDLPAKISAASSLAECQSIARALSPAPLDVLKVLFPYHPPVGTEGPRESLRARTVKTDLPKEIFWLIISFWRSDRDYDPTDIVTQPRLFDADCDADLDDDVPQLEELTDSDDEEYSDVGWFMTPAGYQPVPF